MSDKLIVDDREAVIEQVVTTKHWYIVDPASEIEDTGADYLNPDGSWQWCKVHYWPTEAAALEFIRSLSPPPDERAAERTRIVSPNGPLETWQDASKFSFINRDKIDAIYQAVLHSSMGDPWDAESGCPRMIPETAREAVAFFDTLHTEHIKRVNAALDLIRALYSEPRATKELANELQRLLQPAQSIGSGDTRVAVVFDVPAVQGTDAMGQGGRPESVADDLVVAPARG